MEALPNVVGEGGYFFGGEFEVPAFGGDGVGDGAGVEAEAGVAVGGLVGEPDEGLA